MYLSVALSLSHTPSLSLTHTLTHSSSHSQTHSLSLCRLAAGPTNSPGPAAPTHKTRALNSTRGGGARNRSPPEERRRSRRIAGPMLRSVSPSRPFSLAQSPYRSRPLAFSLSHTHSLTLTYSRPLTLRCTSMSGGGSRSMRPRAGCR